VCGKGSSRVSLPLASGVRYEPQELKGEPFLQNGGKENKLLYISERTTEDVDRCLEKRLKTKNRGLIHSQRGRTVSHERRLHVCPKKGGKGTYLKIPGHIGSGGTLVPECLTAEIRREGGKTHRTSKGQS